MTVYFICTGEGNTERGVVVKSHEADFEDKKEIEVIDELANGSNGTMLVETRHLKEIEYEDYELITRCIQDWSAHNERDMLNKVEELLKND